MEPLEWAALLAGAGAFLWGGSTAIDNASNSALKITAAGLIGFVVWKKLK